MPEEVSRLCVFVHERTAVKFNGSVFPVFTVPWEEKDHLNLFEKQLRTSIGLAREVPLSLYFWQPADLHESPFGLRVDTFGHCF